MPAAATADVALIVGGTRPPALQVRLGLAHPLETIDLGANWYTSVTKRVVEYPATVVRPWLGASIRQGADALEAALSAIDGPVTIVAVSQGTVIVDVVLARLADDPSAPAADKMTVVAISAPNRGLFRLLPQGFNLLGYRVIRPVESRYCTTVIAGEYDLWSDPPDRTWNLIAGLNAVAGAWYTHGQASKVGCPADIPAHNVSVSINAKGATVTELLLPARKLPLVQPLRNLGVREKLVQSIEAPLRLVVDRAYRRHDRTQVAPLNGVGAYRWINDASCASIVVAADRVSDHLQ